MAARPVSTPRLSERCHAHARERAANRLAAAPPLASTTSCSSGATLAEPSWMQRTWHGGSSPSPPSTTSSSCRSRSACPLIVAVFHTAWVRTAQPAVAAADEVLRQALPHQLRPRARHRHRAGVPVRDELERLLALRRRHLRRARWPSRRCSPSSSSRPSSACGSSAGTGSPRSCTPRRSGWCTSARCCRRTSSSPPTPSCSTRSATRTTRRAAAPS